jgi:hypothetical protein
MTLTLLIPSNQFTQYDLKDIANASIYSAARCELGAVFALLQTL